MENVEYICADCSACGACFSICPKQCINYVLSISKGHFCVNVDDRQCIKCGKCLDVCPVVNNEVSSTNIGVGKVVAVYASYSNNLGIRKNAASGGFITSFLCFLLDKNIVDGVLISRRDGVVGKAFIATSKEEVINSKTSIYAPVDYASGIREMQFSDCKKIAVIGLPCHVQAITNLANHNRRIKEKVVIKISILCGKTPSLYAYKYIAKEVGFDYDSIQHVKNRGNGWPGFMEIQHVNGLYRVPYRHKMSMGTVLSSPFLCSRGCLSCVDGVGLSADIVVCDAWLPKYTDKNSDGWNFVLAKTKNGNVYLQENSLADYLHIELETYDNFYQANKRVIDKGGIGNAMRSKECRIMGISQKLSMKQHLYVFLLKFAIKHFDSTCISKWQLFIGKFLNKLKD